MNSGGVRSTKAGATLIVLLTLTNVLNFIDRQLPFILSESIKRDLRLTDTELGLLGGLAFAVCYSVMAVPLGILADRWSPKRLLAGCILVWSGMTAASGFAVNFSQLACARVGVALGEAGCTPAAHVMISRAVDAERRGWALGIFSLGVPAGTMLGLMIGGWVNDHASWRTALIAAGSTGLVLAAAVAIFLPTAQLDAAQHRPPHSASFSKLFHDPAFRALFVAVSLVGASVYATLSFSAPFLIRLHGFTTAQVGLCLGLGQGVTGVLGSLLGGRMFDKSMRDNGRHALQAPAIAFLVAGPAATIAWFAENPVVVVMFLLPVMFAFIFYIPATFGIGHRIAGEGRQATASSVLMIAVGLIGASLGPLLVGLASDALTPRLGAAGLRWALLFTAVTNVLAGVAFLVADRRFRTQCIDPQSSSFRAQPSAAAL